VRRSRFSGASPSQKPPEVLRRSARKRERLKVDPKTSDRMRGVRRFGTRPELALRRWLWRAGFRFRCGNRDLPGTPDIVNRANKWAIFVHGCFWHGHRGCRAASVPKRNRDFWLKKIADNKRRDARKARALRKLGFCVTTVWECRIKILERQGDVDLSDTFVATLRRPRRTAEV